MTHTAAHTCYAVIFPAKEHKHVSSVRPQVAVWNTGRDNRARLLEAELRRVDGQLNFAEPQDAEALWSRRVMLMNALVELHETEAPALQYASYQY